jgi:hypothetical protein
MKLNKDNYELLMFDLLEGNLSEKDELLVMKQIEEDEFFFREWKLFKSTVLVADKDVVFSGKSSLLKDESPVAVVPMFRRWMVVAASVCILAAAVVLWPSSEIERPVADIEIEVPTKVDPVLKTPEVLEDVLVVEDVEPTNNSEQLVKPETNKVQDRFERIDPQYKASKEIFVSIPKDETTIKDVPQVKEIPAFDKIPVKTVVLDKDNTNGNKEPKLDEIEPETPVNVIASVDPPTVVNKTKSQKVLDFVTKTPPRRIKEKAIGIIALVSNPRIKFKPNFKGKKPSLDIELETTGYQAVASIQPFKNRN